MNTLPKLIHRGIVIIMSENTPIEHKRHTLAHLLAATVLQMYPQAKITLGPAVDHGFYYDIDFGEEKISDQILKKLEKHMKKMLPTWKAFDHMTVSVDEAKKIFAGNDYKLELINEIAERGEDITLYYVGPENSMPKKLEIENWKLDVGFLDLCRGGHAQNPSVEIPADSFQLDRVAGAYWRGDENNTMLTRIYGLAFENKEELDVYLNQREEAKKRDHRKLGKELDLFTFSDLVGSGLPLFTTKGTLMRNIIASTIQDIQLKYGYEQVHIPHITKKELYETSGHWQKYKDDLFHVKGKNDTEFVMKPMNCPHHTQIYASKARSYRDLPLRFAETTVCYRDEQPGELLGLSRVRGFTQDDAHAFCRMDQVKQEMKNVVAIVREFYTKLNMFNKGDFWVSLSVRDPQKLEKYLGDDEKWNLAEQILEEVAIEEKLPYKRVEGEAAFYGPKLDFMFVDAIGRQWQLATPQLDFVMPERFGLEYTDADGEKKTPVMIHRAIAGSLERFMSILIEHFTGHFPVWLAPVQAVILPISDAYHADYAQEILEKLRSVRVRAELHTDGSLGKRIRHAKTQKIPYVIILGDAEKDAKTLTIEMRGDEKLEGILVEDFIERIQNESN